MKASEFDKRFDSGEDVNEFLNVENARRPNLEQRRVNIDCPSWMVQSLDKEAERLGVTRQALIKFWLADKLQHPAATPLQ